MIVWHEVRFVNTPQPPHPEAIAPPLRWEEMRGTPVLISFRGKRKDLDPGELRRLLEAGCTECEEMFYIDPVRFSSNEPEYSPGLCRAFFEMD